jgi:hypothetical protein
VQYFVVGKLQKFEDIAVAPANGPFLGRLALARPAEEPFYFLPVFTSWEAATAWLGDDDTIDIYVMRPKQDD